MADRYKPMADWLRYAVRQAYAANDFPADRRTLACKAVTREAGICPPRMTPLRAFLRITRATLPALPLTHRSPAGSKAIKQDIYECAGLDKVTARTFAQRKSIPRPVWDRTEWFIEHCIPQGKVPPPLRKLVLERTALGLDAHVNLGASEALLELRDFDEDHPELTGAFS